MLVIGDLFGDVVVDVVQFEWIGDEVYYWCWFLVGVVIVVKCVVLVVVVV